VVLVVPEECLEIAWEVDSFDEAGQIG